MIYLFVVILRGLQELQTVLDPLFALVYVGLERYVFEPLANLLGCIFGE
jgi:hypothetical protein